MLTLSMIYIWEEEEEETAEERKEESSKSGVKYRLWLFKVRAA